MGGPGRPSLARLQGVLAYHQTLLGDARRNRAFHRALAARLRPGMAVLDLGAGTGVWAVRRRAARPAAARLRRGRERDGGRRSLRGGSPADPRAGPRGFLRPGGALVPESVALAAAPVKAPVALGLAPGVRLSTRRGTHWLPILLPLEPLPAGPGRLDVEVDWNPPRRRWSVRFEGDRGARGAAAHSPLFAWGKVRPAIPCHPPSPGVVDAARAGD